MLDTEDEMSTLQTSRVDALLLQAANTTNTSAHAGYFQQLSADVAKEGVFHYFSTRLAFWIGLVTSIVVMSLLNICLCPTSGDQMIDETFGDVAEAWVPIHKAMEVANPPDAAERRKAKAVIAYRVDLLPKFDVTFYDTARKDLKKSLEVLVPPREARCFEVPAGHFFRISCVEGPQ
eukprot:symbB.v1.2.035707.t1/scaffold4874.1/size33602/1